MKALAVFLTVCALGGAFAQSQPPGTYIGSHRIGETVQEWLANNQLDLIAICQSRKREDKTVCKSLSGFQAGKVGTFYTTNDTKQKYEWLFVDGKVAQVSIEHPLPDTQQQMGFLIEKYGQPTKSETVGYQNAYGAKWDCLHATWEMPDGAAILAAESIKNLPEPTRWLTITFLSAPERDRIQRIHGQSDKGNPYDK
jgi:hypothetical protein